MLLELVLLMKCTEYLKDVLLQLTKYEREKFSCPLSIKGIDNNIP